MSHSLNHFVIDNLYHHKSDRLKYKNLKSVVGLVKIRHAYLKNQERANYNNEYDRLAGILDTGSLTAHDKSRLQNRQETLKKLSSNMFNK